MTQGALPNHKNPWFEPPDHGIGRSRGGLTTKLHLVCDGRGRPLGMVITGGNVNDTTMMPAVLEDIRVPRDGKGRPRTRPDRVLADKGYPSKANRAWLRTRGIAATIPERDDQIAHRRKKPGRPIDFGDQQQERYKGRNVVERCFNKLKQWRGLAMRSDKYARNYHAGICLAATLDWLRTGFSNTPYDRARNRGCRHPHAARILAQGWTRILWRCWHDHQPYNPDLHGRLNTLQQEAA